MTQISSTTEKTFFLTTLDRACTYCTYRSMCGRGNSGGDWDAWDEDDLDTSSAESLDFSALGEIRF